MWCSLLLCGVLLHVAQAQSTLPPSCTQLVPPLSISLPSLSPSPFRFDKHKTTLSPPLLQHIPIQHSLHSTHLPQSINANGFARLFFFFFFVCAFFLFVFKGAFDCRDCHVDRRHLRVRLRIAFVNPDSLGRTVGSISSPRGQTSSMDSLWCRSSACCTCA